MIAGVTLAVRELERVAGFYREVVGLERVAEGGDSVTLGVGGVGFLVLERRAGFEPRDPAAAGLFHTAFVLPSRADLGSWLAHAAAIGLRLDGAADHLVSEAVYLHDPEGNGVEIYADRPRGTWTWEGGRVRMANDRLDMIALRAQAGPRWAGAPAGTRIGHVHLQVGHVDEAERFYTDEFGLAVTARFPAAVFLSWGGYHHHLAANSWNSAGAGRREPGRAGLAAVTLQRPEARGGVGDPWNNLFEVSALRE